MVNLLSGRPAEACASEAWWFGLGAWKMDGVDDSS